jgi:hypothetical protein
MTNLFQIKKFFEALVDLPIIRSDIPENVFCLEIRNCRSQYYKIRINVILINDTHEGAKSK